MEETIYPPKALPRSYSSSGSFKMDQWQLLPSIPITSIKDAEKEMEHLALLLQGKETEMNWDKKEEGLKRLRGIMKSYSSHWSKDPLLHDCIAQGVRNCIEDLLNCTTSLRTTLAVTACSALEDVLLYLGTMLDPISDILLVTLLKPLSSTKKMVHVAAGHAIQMLLQTCSLKTRLIEKITSCADDKNVQIRIYAIQFLQCIVELDPQKCTDLIFGALKKGITNAHPQVRELSRQCYWALVHMNKAKSEMFLNMLDPSTRKLLTKSDKPGTFTSVLTTHAVSTSPSSTKSSSSAAMRSPTPLALTSTKQVSDIADDFPDCSISASTAMQHILKDNGSVKNQDKELEKEKESFLLTLRSSVKNSETSFSGSDSCTAAMSTFAPSPSPYFTSAVDTFVLDPEDLPAYLAVYGRSQNAMTSPTDLEVYVKAFSKPSTLVMALASFAQATLHHGLSIALLPSFLHAWTPYFYAIGEPGYWAHEGVLAACDHGEHIVTYLLHQVPMPFPLVSKLITALAWVPPPSLYSVLGNAIAHAWDHPDLNHRYHAVLVLSNLIGSDARCVDAWLKDRCILQEHVQKAQAWLKRCKEKEMIGGDRWD